MDKLFNKTNSLVETDSSSKTIASKLSDLIDSGDSVDSTVLMSALEKEEITQYQYITLANQLMKKGEWTEDALANVGKKLGDQIEGLGIDPVTNLMRSNFLEERLDRLIKELNFKLTPEKKRSSPLFAVMVIAIDVDNLRIWNTYGHAVGDKALRIIADSVKEVIRDDDGAFRLGDKSDEIIVTMRITQDLEPSKLEEIFRRVKHKLNSKFIEIDNIKLPVTVAAGCAILKPGESRKNKEIIHAADLNQATDKTLEVKEERIKKATVNLNKLN
ncbi:MAG: GGDEF domain-containing protein [Candidatus Paceibacterota bacterium]